MLLNRYMINYFHIKTCWVSVLLLVPALLYSQSRFDSSYTTYDSIQDLSLERLEAQWQYQLRQTREALEGSIRLTDSLSIELNSLNNRIGPLESENLQMKAEMSAIQEQLDKRSEESEIYRKKLRNLLWIAGLTLFLLLLGSFLFLLYYSIRTRTLLDSVRSRLRRLRKVVRKQQGEISKIPVVKKKRIRKIAAEEVKSGLRRKKRRKK